MTHVSRHGIFSSKIFIVSYKQSISAQQRQPNTTHKHLFALCFVVIRSEGRLGDYQRRRGRFPSPTLDARIVWRVGSLVKDAATW